MRERVIRSSSKFHLKNTSLCEAEATVIAVPQSGDHSDLEALTPNHLL